MQGSMHGPETQGQRHKNGHEKTVCSGQSDMLTHMKSPEPTNLPRMCSDKGRVQRASSSLTLLDLAFQQGHTLLAVSQTWHLCDVLSTPLFHGPWCPDRGSSTMKVTEECSLSNMQNCYTVDSRPAFSRLFVTGGGTSAAGQSYAVPSSGKARPHPERHPVVFRGKVLHQGSAAACFLG